jgi:uncharacterized damage-inducible protein DinB
MPRGRPLDAVRESLEEFDRCGRVTEYLVGVIPVRLWHLPSAADRGRTIGAIITHIHGVRKTFARMGGVKGLASLDRRTVAPGDAKSALHQVNSALTDLFRASLERGELRVKGLSRRSLNMMSYLIQHDAHHRGQITMRARDLGHDVVTGDVMRIWGWKKLP